MSLRPMFRKGLRWQIGDGTCVSFWFDCWVFGHPLAFLFPRIDLDPLIEVSEFISEDRHWLHQELSAQVPAQVVLEIENVFLSSASTSDKLIWGLTPHGEYSVQSGAKLLQGYGFHVEPKVKFDWI